jgi:hypothetical protein
VERSAVPTLELHPVFCQPLYLSLWSIFIEYGTHACLLYFRARYPPVLIVKTLFGKMVASPFDL